MLVIYTFWLVSMQTDRIRRAGRQALPFSAVSVLHLPGSQVCSLHYPTLHNPQSRKTQLSHWCIRPEPRFVAWPKARMCEPLLSMSCSNHMVQVVQLTSLRSSNDRFCDCLRQGLKTQLQLGQMKLTKFFAGTLYSEALLQSDAASVTEDDGTHQDGRGNADLRAKPDGEETGETGDYARGLGSEFKFPGDAKK